MSSVADDDTIAYCQLYAQNQVLLKSPKLLIYECMYYICTCTSHLHRQMAACIYIIDIYIHICTCTYIPVHIFYGIYSIHYALYMHIVCAYINT